MKLLENITTYANTTNTIAYQHNEEILTYKELEEQSSRLARYLQETLQDDKTPIPVYGHKSAFMLVCFLACVKSGRAYCPIDTGIPQQRVEAILNSVNAKVILCCDTLPTSIPHVLHIHEIQYAIQTHEPIDSGYTLQEDDVFYIIFTSGSTGIPKGVQITYRNLNNFLAWSIPLANVQSSSHVFINQAPFSFDLSVMDVYTSLASGGTIYALDKDIQKDYQKLFHALESSHANVWVSTPSFADMCLIDKTFAQDKMPQMTTFLFCGEVLRNDTALKLRQRFPNANVINTYGPTESTVAISDVIITEEIIAKYNPLPIGKAKTGTWLKIIDEHGNEVETGQKGEIIIIGNTVGKGYYKNEEQTSKAFFTWSIDNEEYPAYHTGDKGYIEDGMLYYSGRMDLQIKLNGYRIEIADIEENLMKVDFVRHAVVLPNEKDGKIKNLVAYVVYDGDTSNRFQTGQQIASQLKAFVPDYMVPKKYIFVNEIPMTMNGKADRKALLGVCA